MQWFTCGQCKSVEFQPIVQVNISAEGKVIEIVETGTLKCSNCATRYRIDDDAITVLEAAPQSGARPPRVRSSVSSEARGKDAGSGPARF